MAGGIALANVLLIRHGRGFLEVTDPTSIAQWGRIEAHLSLGGLVDPVQIQQQAQAFLALSGQLSLNVTAGVEPAGSDTPYADFTVGDVITIPDESGVGTTTEQVVSITVTEDEEGNPNFAVELGVPSILHEQRIQHWLTRLLNGTVAGTAQSASPVDPPPPQGPEASAEIITFQQPGRDSLGNIILLKAGESQSQPVNKSGVLTKVVVFLDGPQPGFGTGSNVLAVYVNHVRVTPLNLGIDLFVVAGQQMAVGWYNVPVNASLNEKPDVISVEFTTVDGVAFGGMVLVTVQ